MAEERAWLVVARVDSVDRVDWYIDHFSATMPALGLRNLLSARAQILHLLCRPECAAAGSDSDTAVPLAPRHLAAYRCGIRDRPPHGSRGGGGAESRPPAGPSNHRGLGQARVASMPAGWLSSLD